ncbi:hypothetical protein EV401DRAFT_2069910 [Pisolithus croceorrhizus]|nr:hypothetical protein EV401DRAFT_2069910 [Pisolithus croceorrhizus]
MSFTNINDPEGIKALLEQLRASQVWQSTVNTAVPPTSPSVGAPTPDVAASNESTRGERSEPSLAPLSSPRSQSIPPQPGSGPAATGFTTKATPSVASLLSQLNASGWSQPSSTAASEGVLALSSTGTAGPSRVSNPQSSSLDRQSFPPGPKQQQIQPLRSPNPPQPSIATIPPEEDVRFITFQQALPHLSQLASNSKFIAAVGRLRGEQKELEQKLWEERSAIRRKHEEKVKVARTKASMTGAELSKHEVDVRFASGPLSVVPRIYSPGQMLNDAFRREVQKFDAERVLIAWDALIEKQQVALETLGVPAMFRTGSKENLEVSGDSSNVIQF